MVEAAITGAVDYRTFNRRDPQWWRRHSWVMAGLQRQQELQAMTLKHQHTLGQLAIDNLAADSFESVQKQARQSYLNLVNRIFSQPVTPEEDARQTRLTKEEAGNYRQMFINTFNVDPSSPEFLAAEAELIRRGREEEEKRKHFDDPQRLLRQRMDLRKKR